MRTIFELGKIVNSRHYSGRRDGNSIRNDVKAVRIRHQPQSLDEVVKIQKRLACSHSDEVRAVRRFRADAVNVIENDNDLFNDLADGQVSQKSKLRRQAEIAFQWAAGLR